MADFYVPSTRPGFSFFVYAHKPQGRPPYVMAVEGELKDEGQFRSFSYILHEARGKRVNLAGNNTKGNRKVAFNTLLDDLVADGWVTVEDAAEARTKLG
jgi:hypothetical protein